MKKEEIYKVVLDKVTEVTGLSGCDIIHSNREECSDARFLLVRSLARFGLTDTEIGTIICRTRKGVAYIRQHDARSSKWKVGSDWEAIRKWIGSNYFI